MAESQLKVFEKLREDFKQNQQDDLWGYLAEGLEKAGCADYDYIQHTEGHDIDEVSKNINQMNFEECCAWLTWILRGERFCDGLFASCLEQGHLAALLDRACEVLKEGE